MKIIFLGFMLALLAFMPKHLIAEIPEDSVPQPLEQGISDQRRSEILKILAAAELDYLSGVDSHNRGELKKSRRHFRNALKKLSSKKFEHNLLYTLSDDFESMFQDLTDRLNLLESSVEAASQSLTAPIPVDENDPAVRKYLKTFTNGGRRSVQQAFDRMGLYSDIIIPALKTHKLPEELIFLPIVESRYSVGDVSHAGAVGIWQFMRDTARGYGMRVDYWIDERRDPEKATHGALRYLKELYFLFNDWHLALAAYNRGEFGIGRDLEFSRATDFTNLASRKAIPKETELYVPQLVAVILIARDPEKYGFKINPLKPLEYDIYETDVMIDLDIAAKCAEVSKEEIKRLNPAINAWCTPKNYPGYKLKLPKGTLAKFEENLKLESDLCPAREFVKHKIQKGDYLGKIAKTYHTTVSQIKQDNNIKNERLLRPGKTLIIKPGRGYKY